VPFASRLSCRRYTTMFAAIFPLQPAVRLRRPLITRRAALGPSLLSALLPCARAGQLAATAATGGNCTLATGNWQLLVNGACLALAYLLGSWRLAQAHAPGTEH
jgi:hypothetical protein